MLISLEIKVFNAAISAVVNVQVYVETSLELSQTFEMVYFCENSLLLSAINYQFINSVKIVCDFQSFCFLEIIITA